MSPGPIAESYPAFALNRLRENRIKTSTRKQHLDPFRIRIQLAKLKNLFTKVEASGA